MVVSYIKQDPENKSNNAQNNYFQRIPTPAVAFRNCKKKRKKAYCKINEAFIIKFKVFSVCFDCMRKHSVGIISSRQCNRDTRVKHRMPAV